jgi:cell division protein FtsB
VKLRRVILSLYVLLFAGLGMAGVVLFKDAHDEFGQLEQVESANRRRLAEAQERLRREEKVLDRLRNDPAYVDRVIRMKLGYAKPDEFIFRFEDENSRGVTGPSSGSKIDE